MGSLEMSEKLGEAFVAQVVSDDERNNASDTILQRRFWMTALRICWLPYCGWTSKSLFKHREFGTAYPEEDRG